MSKLQLTYPLDSVTITQRFGENQTTIYKDDLHINGHNGIDFVAPDGTPVYAAHDGEITFAGEDGSGGLGVVIRTLEQYDYGTGQSYFKSIYWHLKKNSILVSPNQIVKRGQQIAGADNTGLTTGSHLHFGLKPIAQGEQPWQWDNIEQNNGYNGAIDPLGYFDATFPKKVPPKPVSAFSRDMYFGMSGDDVRNLQKRFVGEGFGNYEPTGYFGVKTLASAIAYQKAKHISPALGYVGKLTRAELNK